MTPPNDKPRRLGRGLEALLSARPDIAPTVPAPAGGGAGETPYAETPGAGSAAVVPSPFRPIPIAQVRPNPHQPRKEFRDEELADLTASLKASGLLQPITVRVAHGEGGAADGFELVAGERRLRAAQRLGWTEIPAIVKEIDDRALATLGLVENLQRVDLNPIEEALGYQSLIDEFALTQQQVADVVGKDRSTVANMLRLLTLPAGVRRMVQQGELTLGHARALLAVGHEHPLVELAKEVVAKGLSVREVEQRARDLSPKKAGAAGAKPGRPVTRDPEARRIEDQLRRYLQTDVSLNVQAGTKGEIRIQFYSNEDLERILELLLDSPDEMP
jgi:ParB family transcriptional regulator, chromosome partitioning protein